MVTELVEGETLGKWLKRPATAERSIELARQVLEALRAAHGAGIIHRDLKPGIPARNRPMCRIRHAHRDAGSVHALRALCFRSALAYALAVRLCRDGVRGRRSMGTVAIHLVVPHVEWTAAYSRSWWPSSALRSPLSLLLASLAGGRGGIGDPAEKPLLQAPADAPGEMRRMRLDTSSAWPPQIVALFIVLTTAVTLNADG